MPERFGPWSMVHQQFEPSDHALGRSPGLTIKIHMLCDANGVLLRFLLSGGQASYISYAHPLLDEA
jgi:hypothetical protein